MEGGQGPEWLIRLTDWLSYNGYQVVTKPTRALPHRAQDDRRDGRAMTDARGSLLVELCVDMLTLAPALDTVILFSSDGSCQSLVRAVQRLGCRVLVVSSEKTGESAIAVELRRQADGFVELATLGEHITMADRAAPVEEG